MRPIYDLQQLIKTTLNTDKSLSVKKKILKTYGISFIETTQDGALRFQCWNTDPRWFGKKLLAKPSSKQAKIIPVMAIHAIDAHILNQLDTKYKDVIKILPFENREFATKEDQDKYMKEYIELASTMTKDLEWTMPDGFKVRQGGIR